MSAKYRPESRFGTYEAYVAWYRITFEGTERMLSQSEWRERYGVYFGPGSQVWGESQAA